MSVHFLILSLVKNQLLKCLLTRAFDCHQRGLGHAWCRAGVLSQLGEDTLTLWGLLEAQPRSPDHRPERAT